MLGRLPWDLSVHICFDLFDVHIIEDIFEEKILHSTSTFSLNLYRSDEVTSCDFEGALPRKVGCHMVGSQEGG